ncbi:GNAT family N-acetyltransferase [Dactylosporangium sp. NBC_01737]|uniref:GNAT family N-acetyltransferase n=1 Tax=Dactylosporangium sp. NBC_01737 TaxID=2975959 RepID=UPI002E11D3D0|nr:GNAT family N-acetyltransferase [Dactylosporangium sp. NBC_01737]
MPAQWTARPATPADVEPIAELRAVVLRADLERLGRFDEHRVRQRLRDSYTPRHTTVILAAGTFAGCVALRPAGPERWLEHFYLDPALQGRGIGTAVLRTVLRDADGLPVRLNVLQGSAALRLYERHEFVVQTQDPVDVFMLRPPASAAALSGRAGAGAASTTAGPDRRTAAASAPPPAT